MAVVLLMMAVITGLVYFTVRNYMLEEAQERYEGILKKNKEEFRRRLSDVYVAAKNNIHDIERDIGNYIMHPDQKRILNTSFWDLTKESPDSWVYYRTIKYVDWTIVIVVPKEVISHNGLILNTIILLTMLFGLVAIFFICRHMIRQTTRPLHSFALSADEVALGNFSSPLPDVQGSDEVRMLAALRLLREQPNYTIAVVAEEAGFANVRTLQRRIQDAIGMSPVDYRIMLTRDLKY